MDGEDGLVRRAREGDRTAFEELVRRTTRMVYAKLYLETGDPHQAEDLVQETFLRAFRSIHQVSDPAGFRAWLAQIAGTAAIDAFRRSRAKRRAEPGRAPSVVLEGVAAPEVDDPGLAETRERARVVLQSLPEEYRLPLTMRYLDGADYETITAQLGMSGTSLRGILHRGLQMLRKAVKLEKTHESR
ncbi:MAG TPA: sigma-70 family RNA polymerase sigma factor [Planctomycetota bacterium]